jgi:uncharacterized phage protein (TIGR02220 family)
MNSYFSHDSNARNDEKIARLRMKHGSAGYGVYFMILERLREAKDYMSIKDYNLIAFDLRDDSQLIKSVVEDFGLFAFVTDKDRGECFYSKSFNDRMVLKDEKSKKRAEAGKRGAAKRWGDKVEAESSTNDSNAMAKPSKKIASKEKESKVNKSKEDTNSPAEAEQHEPESFNYAGVIQYLNDQSGKHFRNTKTNQKLIRSRLDEGFDRHDIRMAIDHVVQAWKGDPEMDRYIQPSTIFRASKFEGYVNSVPGGKQSKGKVRESTPDWAQDDYQHEHKPVDQGTVDEVKARMARLKQEQAQED